VRRLQSEGSRYDSEAVAAAPEDGPAFAARLARPLPTWKPLQETDLAEMESFDMAVAEDPAKRRRLLPTALAISKLKFLGQEVFGDFSRGQWGTFEFYMNLLTFLVAFWVRTYVHFVCQYFYLQSLGTPVYGFSVLPYVINFKYMSTSLTEAQETGVVALGPIGCVVAFVVMALLGSAFYRFAHFFPDSASMFVAAFGVWATLDPFLVMAIDLLAQNFNCSSRSAACSVNYTATDCSCFNGDFIKLWVRMSADEGSGVSGLLITCMLYVGIPVASSLFLHEYLVRMHKNARVLDLWRRIHAHPEEFFIPNDFEISQQELLAVCNGAARWRGPNGATRKVVVSEYVDRDPYDPDFEERTLHYAIYELNLAGTRSLYRHFLMLPDGSIIEVFEKLPIGLSSAHKYLESLFEKDDLPHDSEGHRLDKQAKLVNGSLFAGLEHV